MMQHPDMPWFMKDPWKVEDAYMEAEYLVLDFETTNLDYGDATNPANEIICAAWYKSGGNRVHYQRGNEFQQEQLLKDIEYVLAAGGFIVAHNAKFEIKWLIRMGIDPRTILCYDTMLAEHVRRGNRQYMKVNLNETAQRYGCTAKAYTVDLLLKCGVDPRTYPDPLIRARVVKDVKDTTRTFLRQRELLVKREQLPVVATRCLFTPCLADMEMAGMYLDKNQVLKAVDEARTEQQLLQQEWVRRYGDVNPRSIPDMARLIYDKLGFEELRDRRGKPIRNKPTKQFPEGTPKVDEKTLAKLATTTREQQDFVVLRSGLGKVNAKLSKTLEFFEGIVNERDCTFYGQFNQAVAQTHRLSSSSLRVEFGDGKTRGVQLQNLPREYKHLIGPGRDDWVVGEVDGSQLEFRVAAFLGQDKQAMEDIKHGVDRHTQTAQQYFGIKAEDWDALPPDTKKRYRQEAKAETFKPLYGGRRGTPDQERYYEWFRKQFPELAAAQEGWTYEVLANGSLKMPWGMEWYWPGTRQDPKTGYIDNTPSIYNYPVQNLATGEIIPIAVTYLWHRLRETDIQLFNTVHDSAIARFSPRHKHIFEAMSTIAFTDDVYRYLDTVYGIQFNVPLGVGITVGDRWASPDAEEKTFSRRVPPT